MELSKIGCLLDNKSSINIRIEIGQKTENGVDKMLLLFFWI